MSEPHVETRDRFPGKETLMGRLALIAVVLLLNLCLIFVFSTQAEVTGTWRQYICLFIGVTNVIAVIKDIILLWRGPGWLILEELTEDWAWHPFLMMISNSLALLIFGLVIANRIFGGPGAGFSFGHYLLAVVAPAVSLYYAYIFGDEER